MALPLKLSAIEQQHLQELYDAAGVPRDALPYTPVLDQMCQDFQDRAFKNAGPAQVYGALVKYIKSSKCPKSSVPEQVDEEPLASQLKRVREHRVGKPKLSPYTPEFDSARREFTSATGIELSESDFYRGIRLAAERPAARPRRGAASSANAATTESTAAENGAAEAVSVETGEPEPV
jgi:hypothetical protein